MDKIIIDSAAEKIEYTNSQETMKLLKVSSCELMHLRVTNRIKFIKRGNGYFYQVNSLKQNQ